MSNDNKHNQNNGGSNGKDNGHDHDLPDNVIRIPSLAERDKMRRAQEEAWRAQYRADNKAEPMINLPPMTKILLAAFIIPHILITFLLDPPTQYWVYEHFGFKPAYYTVSFPGIYALIGPISYAFLHNGWMHLCMNSAMMAAFGAGLEKWIGGKRMLILFLSCSIAACFFHFILSPFSENTMVGASGGVSGLFAAILLVLQQQGRLPYSKYGLLPLAGLWIVISFIFGILGGPDGSAIAWAAHIGGFLAGFALFKPVMRIK